MQRKNRYCSRSKISEARFRALVRCWSLDLTATNTAQLTGLSVRSVNTIFLAMRRVIAHDCEQHSPFTGQVEVDESFFGPWRVRGKRGRGAGKKTIVFGMLKRGQHVYTQIVPNCKTATLQALIRGHIRLESEILSDCLSSYDGLVDLGYAKHWRIRHSGNHFAEGDNHINGIESFWSFAKRRLAKFNGLAKTTFYLHLKECEFRFNHRHDDLYRATLKLLRSNPL
ncbi:IS1595-like element ISLgu1 family transposase [Lysobacter gummosus]|uniref:IS1595-like element ISLgu1 family transposase n=1 Tax=Lysobacter gummosus TaxID=262324 RepID=UPI00363B1911